MDVINNYISITGCECSPYECCELCDTFTAVTPEDCYDLAKDLCHAIIQFWPKEQLSPIRNESGTGVFMYRGQLVSYKYDFPSIYKSSVTITSVLSDGRNESSYSIMSRRDRDNIAVIAQLQVLVKILYGELYLQLTDQFANDLYEELDPTKCDRKRLVDAIFMLSRIWRC